MTFKRIDREYRTLSAAYNEFPLQTVLQCDQAELPNIVAMLRRQRDNVSTMHSDCPHSEKADYGWQDGAVPSIRESGKPGSKERIEALREWYSVQTDIEENDGDDGNCSSAFIPVANPVGNVRLSDSMLSFSVERSTDE